MGPHCIFSFDITSFACLIIFDIHSYYMYQHFCSFCYRVVFHSIYTSQCIYSPMDGHMGFFGFVLAKMNKVAMNI